jgi:septum formation protein
MTSGLILASTSRYRRALLTRLGLPFDVQAPAVDESPGAGETPLALVSRLAAAKADAVARLRPDDWVIGSDQIAVCDEVILGKPGTAERCIAQLEAASGKPVTFLTAVCIRRGRDDTSHAFVDRTVVRFRANDPLRIRRYVELEQPFDCAGGFKCEGLGIALFERIESSDPTALIGLPLIQVAATLAAVGLDPLAPA